jgi:hypothetical protein
MDELTSSLQKKLAITDDFFYSENYIRNVVLVQSTFRLAKYRRHTLPNSILSIQRLLENSKISLTSVCTDGRTNSSLHEDTIIDILYKNVYLRERLFIPESRHWFDIGINDYQYGWLPINIKSTSTTTADNTGNLAMCVYSLTSFHMQHTRSYQNGKMSKVLVDCFQKKEYNTILKRDYYFLVIDKRNCRVIVNSVKGLKRLTSNINNLPFQIKWIDNHIFVYQPIETVVKMVKDAIKRPKPSWQETFLAEIRGME